MTRAERLAIAARLRARLAHADRTVTRSARRGAAAGDVAAKRERDPLRRAVMETAVDELRQAVGLRQRAAITVPTLTDAPCAIATATLQPISRNAP